MLGLCGAHRTGKTTLARQFAEAKQWRFEATSVSAIFKELGYDPAQKFDFKTRLKIQNEILTRLGRFYSDISGYNVITDRTPIDFLGYTYAEVQGDTLDDEDQAALDDYTDRCYKMASRHFSALVIVQPGIPIVHEEGKASPSKGYIEHLNATMMGLMQDPRCTSAIHYIPRTKLTIEDRIKSLVAVEERCLTLTAQMRVQQALSVH